MVAIPLFPLNTVLFPGLPLKLHIFEPRYRKMLQDCLAEGNPFGVVLIKRGAEALGPLAEPHQVGCIGKIVEMEQLAGGKSNLTVMGRDRFRIISLDRSRPYLTGQVAILPLQNADSPLLEGLGRQLRPWVERYLQLLVSTQQVRLSKRYLPSDPVSLAYLAAMFLQMPAPKKQVLLEVDDATELITHVGQHYRREVALLKAILKGGRDEKGFGKN